MSLTKSRWMAAGTLAGLLWFTPLAGAQKADRAEILFEAASKKELVDGNLKDAIELYSKIVQSANRELAARAHYRTGQCYEKLGQRDAAKSYETIVKNFADQRELAAQARARLTALAGPGANGNGGVRLRSLWDNAIDLWGTASADGRWLSFVDWDSGDLAIRDLQLGQNRRVTEKGGYEKAQGEAEASAISPDGKRIAFSWLRWDKAAKAQGYYELHVISADGKGERVLLGGKEIRYLEPHSWSPDGKWIAAGVEISSPETTNNILLISPDDAQTRVLANIGNRWPNKITFSPDGRWLALSAQVDRNKAQVSLYTLPGDGASVVERALVADANMMGWTPDGSALLFTRERNGSHSLYLLPVSQGKAAGEPRQIYTVSNVGGALLTVTQQGTLIYGETKRTTDAFIAEVDVKTGRIGNPLLTFPAAIVGQMGTGGGVRFSPNGKQFFCTVPPKGILIHSMENGAERTITPQLTGLRRVEWSPDGASLLISGVGNDNKEGLYRVDLASGAATLLADIKPAYIFVPSKDGKTIYYNTKTREAVIARDLGTGNERTVYTKNKKHGGPLNIQVSHNGMKLALLTPGLLEIMDTATGQVRERYVDAAKVLGLWWGVDWSADDRYLLAIERTDSVGKRSEIWSFAVDGGEPARYPLPAGFRGLSVSPDGKHLGMTHWDTHQQVWALENFLPAMTAQRR